MGEAEGRGRWLVRALLPLVVVAVAWAGYQRIVVGVGATERVALEVAAICLTVAPFDALGSRWASDDRIGTEGPKVVWGTLRRASRDSATFLGDHGERARFRRNGVVALGCAVSG